MTVELNNVLKSARVVLLGARGMLGSEIATRCDPLRLKCVTIRDDFNAKHLNDAIEEWRPDFIINCAANTDVERNESDPRSAFAVNAFLPDFLAQASRRMNVKLVHFSSTGCYGNYKSSPYHDYDRLSPTTVHHCSKAAGEASIIASRCDHLILRLGWLYGGKAGQNPKNFVWNRILEAAGRESLGSDPSQHGNPSNVRDVGEQLLLLLEAGLDGVFNCVATGGTSRLEYVSEIVKSAKLSVRVEERAFTRSAPVSHNEAAINLKLDLLGLNRMPDWRVGLARYVEELNLSNPSVARA